MHTIIKAVKTTFTISKANSLATELNKIDEVFSDDWTYAVVEIEKNPGMAIIAITDEDGHFVGNL